MTCLIWVIFFSDFFNITKYWNSYRIKLLVENVRAIYSKVALNNSVSSFLIFSFKSHTFVNYSFWIFIHWFLYGFVSFAYDDCSSFVRLLKARQGIIKEFLSLSLSVCLSAWLALGRSICLYVCLPARMSVSANRYLLFVFLMYLHCFDLYSDLTICFYILLLHIFWLFHSCFSFNSFKFSIIVWILSWFPVIIFIWPQG